MTGSTISGTIKTTVVLGSSAHPSPLTITTTGDVAPLAFNAIGISAPGTLTTAVYLTNSGTISGGYGGSGGSGVGGGGGIGVALAAVSTVTNNGTIIGGSGGYGGEQGGTGGWGVALEPLSAAILQNYGTIAGGKGGATSFDGGYGGGGAYLGGIDTLVNFGIIAGGNGTNGSKVGLGGIGIDLSGTNVLTNDGTIMGGYSGNGVEADAVLFGTAVSTLIVDPGAVFLGNVVANRTLTDVLQLASSSTAGYLYGLDSKYVNFNDISISNGASWQIESNVDAFNQTETIQGFSVSDTFVLDGFAEKTYSLGHGVVLSNGISQETVDIVGSFNISDLIVTTEAGNTTIALELNAPCFVKGTKILTFRGKKAVEKLKIGDLVKTMHRGYKPIKWIGTRSYDGRFCAGNHLILPVRIKRHAIAKNIPSRDLFVSPGHAICEGGVLIPAWRLVNGVSIIQAEQVETVTYYHVELEQHDIIFSENCPTESFLDENCRNLFHNAAEFNLLYPGSESTTTSCLPRLEDGFYLQRIQSCLNARAGLEAKPVLSGILRGYVDQVGPNIITGWAQDISAPEEPIHLEVIVEGFGTVSILANHYRADLRAVGLGSGCHGFHLRLPCSITGGVEVRRSADGVSLPFSEEARAA